MPPTKAERIRARFDKRMDLFEAYTSLEGGGTAFVGDSLVQNAKWNALLPREPSRNYGFKSDTAERLFERSAAVLDVQPGRIVLLIGTNDVRRDDSQGAMVWIDRIIQGWRARRPDLDIAILAVPPRWLDLMDGVKALNRELKTYAATYGLTFIDETAVLLGPDGGLDPRWSKDGVHLNPAAYDLWIGALKPHLRRFGVDVRPAGPPDALVEAVAVAIAAEEDRTWTELSNADQHAWRRQAAQLLVARDALLRFEKSALASRRKARSARAAPAPTETEALTN